NTIHIRDLSPKRDYLYINDFSDLILKIIEKNKISGLEIYNVGFGESYSVSDIIRIISEITNISFDIIESGQKRKNEISNCYADITKIRKTFNWFPKVSLHDGLSCIYKSKINIW
ncbi:MAG: GDP-mannose 4,6-dehydratase, partial [Nanoarchaeota archaeon]|nr:GDP-mannose 4,6-dehydratase [Nanoarchaeota archaeon]